MADPQAYKKPAGLESEWMGIDNIHDPASLPDGYVVTATDGLFSDTGTFVRRQGYKKKVSGTPHSIWCNGEKTFYVESSTLKRFTPPAGSTSLLSLGSNARVVYAGNERIAVFSNGAVIGRIMNGVAALATDPETTRTVDGDVTVELFKEKLPAGSLVTAWNGELFIATEVEGNTWIYHTDGYDWDGVHVDSYIAYPGKPTMLEAVDDGICIGAGNAVHFWNGGDGTSKLLVETVTKGAVVTFDGTKAGLNGKAVAFATDTAIYLCGNSGTLVNLSGNSVAITGGTNGAAYFREHNGMAFAVFVITDESGTSIGYQSQAI